MHILTLDHGEGEGAGVSGRGSAGVITRVAGRRLLDDETGQSTLLVLVGQDLHVALVVQDV